MHHFGALQHLEALSLSLYIHQSPIKFVSRQRAGFFDVWRVD